MIRNFGFWLAAAAKAMVLHILAPVAVHGEVLPSHTPPRLSLLEGDVSFWRPAFGGWRDAPINLPLAPGDVLATGNRSRAELQLHSRVFLRVGSASELKLADQTSATIQFELHRGVLGLDLRDEPNSILLNFAIGPIAVQPLAAGFYKVELRGGRAQVIARNGARAIVATHGTSRELGPGFEITVDVDSPQALLARPAPEPDDWDRWNFARTDALLRKGAGSAEEEELVGVRELDRYGEWKSVPQYGRVWFPHVPHLWKPYTTGQWIWDPLYGWTWVDATPWGWAPFHYGRWVWIRGRWGWTLGPVFVRPVYAPALVVFLVGKGGFVGFTTGAPLVAWIPLSWGEPCIPWWGPAWFAGRPWWGGWYGPRRWKNSPDPFDGADGNVSTHFEHARDRRGLAGAQIDRFGITPVPSAWLQNIEIERVALPASDFPAEPNPTPPATERSEALPLSDRARLRATRRSNRFSPAPRLDERRRRSPVEYTSPNDESGEHTEAPFDLNPFRQPRPERHRGRWSRFAPPIQSGDNLHREVQRNPGPSRRVPIRVGPSFGENITPGTESHADEPISWPGARKEPRLPQFEFRDADTPPRPPRAWQHRNERDDAFPAGRVRSYERTGREVPAWIGAPTGFGAPGRRPPRPGVFGGSQVDGSTTFAVDASSDSTPSLGKRQELRFRQERGPLQRGR